MFWWNHEKKWELDKVKSHKPQGVGGLIGVVFREREAILRNQISLENHFYLGKIPLCEGILVQFKWYDLDLQEYSAIWAKDWKIVPILWKNAINDIFRG